MALSNPQSVPGTEDVCKIKVVFRYKDLRDNEHYDKPFISRILKVSDFNPDSSFKYIYFHDEPNLRWYEYPDSFIVPTKADKIVEPSAETFSYVDYESFTGIMYWVEWLRNDNKCNLYIDNVELYDNDGWRFYLEDPIGVSDSIKAYAQSFSDWDNIMYWVGVDEPSVIDAYIPVQTVNSILVDSAGVPPLLNYFNPSWTHDHLINGEFEIEQPAQMIISNQRLIYLFQNSAILNRKFYTNK